MREDDLKAKSKAGQLSINSSDPSNVRRKDTIHSHGVLWKDIEKRSMRKIFVDDALSLFRQLLTHSILSTPKV